MKLFPDNYVAQIIKTLMYSLLTETTKKTNFNKDLFWNKKVQIILIAFIWTASKEKFTKWQILSSSHANYNANIFAKFAVLLSKIKKKSGKRKSRLIWLHKLISMTLKITFYSICI